MGYKIRVRYTTGDSFNPPTATEQVLDLEWNDLAKAGDNLNRIEEHARSGILDIAFLAKPKYKALIEKLKTERWYAGARYSYIVLEDDHGDSHEIYCNWTGYFETLIGAEIFKYEEKLPSFEYF